MNRTRILLGIVLTLFAFASLSWAETSAAPSKDARKAAKKPAEEVLDPEDAKLPLVAPYGAVARSAIVPGWGQWVIHEPLQGTFFLTTTAGLATAWFLSHQEFRDIYDNQYLIAVRDHGLNSDEAESSYLLANQHYKTSRALLFTMMGVWAYSLIDAYVDSSIYNAELRSKRVLEQGEQIRKINIRWRGGPMVQWIRRF